MRKKVAASLSSSSQDHGAHSRTARAPSWAPIASVVIAALGLVPTIYFYAQTGDGFELVVTALKGGILHPPGFPVQAWLNRLFIQVPLLNPDFRISLISLLSHLGTVFLIADTVRRLGCAPMFQVLGGLSFAFYLPMWILGVQPEVFALTHFLMALFFWYGLRLAVARPDHPPTIQGSLLLGALFGLCISQHLISGTLVAVYLTVLVLLYKRRADIKGFLAAIGASLGLATTLYATLPLFATEALTPSWGQLDSPLKVLQHAVRWEYGIGSLSAVAGTESHSGIRLLITMLFKQWHVLLIPLFFGMREAARSISMNFYVKSILFGQLAMGLILLVRAHMSDEKIISEYVLMRFQGPTMLVLAIFLAVGAEALIRQRWPGMGPKAIRGSAAGFIAVLYFYNLPFVRPPREDVLEQYMEAVRISLPEDAVYISSSDVECFKGVKIPGGVRYPIEAGILDAEWYYRNVLPRQEPRIRWSKRTPPTIKSIIEDASRLGLKVASTNAKLLLEYGTLEIRGIIYILTPSSSSADRGKTLNVNATARTLSKANEVCATLVSAEEVTPTHATARVLLTSMSVAFEGAAGYLRHIQQPELAKPYQEVAAALKDGHPEATWRTHCQRLASGGP